MAPKDKNIFRIHLGLVIAECVCVPAFAFETYRALSGNVLSWAYVVEWPALGVYAIYMWKKMLRDERGLERPRKARPETNDTRLAQWNEYLEAVHRDHDATPEIREN